MIKNFLIGVSFCLAPVVTWAQCCAGGAGSPIAGGVSQGVLAKTQLELSSNYQMNSTHKFMREDLPDTAFIHSFRANYLYFRAAYGLTDRFTFSVESGYFIDKTQIELNGEDRIVGNGIGDLILFPRYNVFRSKNDKCSSELTLGTGFKLPLGSYNDSIGRIEPFSGMTYYVTKPMVVQPSSGAIDLIFYSFLYRGYKCDKFRLFSSALYIRKGWNPRGEKIGDFGSVGLFGGWSIRPKLNLTVNVRGEFISQTQVNPDILMYTALGYDPKATGSKKVFAGVQAGFSPAPGFMVFASTEYPLYQYVNSAQMASQYQFTAGLSFRQLLKKTEE